MPSYPERVAHSSAKNQLTYGFFLVLEPHNLKLVGGPNRNNIIFEI